MKGEKERGAGCTQLKEKTAGRKAGLAPVGLQSVGFAFADMMKLV